MADPLRPTDPRTIGRYRTLARLGQGGMGSVYLAEEPGGRRVALKVIRPEYAHEPEFRARFRSEVNRAREVPPFCTAEVLDADPDHVTPYLVVEYVDGPSLGEVVAGQGPLTGGSLHGVAVGVAAALAAIHGAGVIHRDLKPRNVLFALGTPKVIDFGIARPLEPTSFHTSTEQVVGTLAYMAPERLDPDHDRLLTPAVDVFAWGAVVTYAGTGRTPFGGDSPAVTAARILTQPPRVRDLPPYLAELVTAALEKQPENRPTAPELLDRLLVSGAPSTPPLPAGLRRTAEAAQLSGRHRTGPARRRRIRRRVAVAAAVTAAAVTVAGVAGALLRPPEPVEVTHTPIVSGPAVFDPLQRDALFNAKGACSYRQGLRVTGPARCGDFLGTVFPPSQNISVRATLSGRACAAIWFRAAADVDGYRVAVCPDSVSLISSTNEKGEIPIVTAASTTTAGTPHHVQVVVDGQEAAVSVDGTAVLRGPLTENTLVSGRVFLGATGSGAATFTDARFRSGTAPDQPPVPDFVTGDAEFTAETELTWHDGRAMVVDRAQFLSGADYCRRLRLPDDAARCADPVVALTDDVNVSLPIAASPVYYDYDADPQKCTDPRTRAAICEVSFRDFATTTGGAFQKAVLVTVRAGQVVSVARLHIG